jgi:RHS repeat-associated protein
MTKFAVCVSRYTGKERDAETGLDYFGARYLSSTEERFTGSDPSNLSVDFWMPQTWNRYAYALNNPLAMVDQNGLWPFYIHNQGKGVSLDGEGCFDECVSSK